MGTDLLKLETDLFLAMISYQLDDEAKHWDELPKLCNLIITLKSGKEFETASWRVLNDLILIQTNLGIKRAIKPEQVASVAVLPF